MRVADTRPSPPFAARARSRVARTCRFAAGPFTRRDVRRRGPDCDQPGRAQGSAGRSRRRLRAARSSSGDIELFARELPPEQKVLADHRLERQIDGHRADGRARAAPAGLAAVVAGNIGDAVLDALPADATLARRLRARALELPAGDDILARARRRPPCSTSRTTISIATRGIDDVRGGQGAHLPRRRHPGAEPRRSALARDAHSRAASCRPSAPAFPNRRRPGASSIAAPKAAGCRSRGSRAAARCSLPASDLTLVGRHNAQNALAALALASAVVEDRPPRARSALARFEGLPHRMQTDRRRGRRAVRRRFEGHDGRRDARGARRARPARSC